MCDFRNPPFAVEDIALGFTIKTQFNGNINIHEKDKVTEKGMYYICASGSYYSYYDGRDWWRDYEEFGDYKDIVEIPLSFNRYRFLYEISDSS